MQIFRGKLGDQIQTFNSEELKEHFHNRGKPKFFIAGIFLLSLATIHNNVLAGRGYPPIIIYATGAGFILNFGLNLLFIPRYGITGAAITSSISYFVMFFMVLIYSVKIMHSRVEKFLHMAK